MNDKEKDTIKILRENLQDDPTANGNQQTETYDLAMISDSTSVTDVIKFVESHTLIGNQSIFGQIENFIGTPIPQEEAAKGIMVNAGLELLHEFNMVFSYNYAFSSPNAPTMQNIITPTGFVLPGTSAEIKDGKVTVSLPALNSAITVNISEVNISVNALICNYEQIIDTDPFFKIISVSKEVIDFNFSEPYNLEMKFSNESAATTEQYNKKIIFLAVATKSAYNEIVRYSQSLSLQSN